MVAPFPIAAALSLAVLTLAGPAGAAGDAKSKLHRRPPTPATATASTGLRGSLASDLPSSAAEPRYGSAAPGVASARTTPAPAPTTGPVLISSTSQNPAPYGLTPLKSSADARPLCRAQCAKTRIVCSTTDADDCDPRWSICVSDCSAAGSR